MRTISTYITIILLFVGGSLRAQDELNGYLKTAGENNPGLKAKFNTYMAAMERVPQVGALPDPTVAFGFFILPLETRVGPQRFKASIAQRFPWFGLLNAREDVATEYAKSKLEVFEDARSKLFYDVRSTYYNLYFIEKGIAITKENIDILATFKQLALIKFEAGKGSAVDELRVELEIADLENQLGYLIDRKYEMEAHFNNLLNVADESQVLIPNELWEEKPTYDRSTLMDSIALNNHRIKQIEHRILSWENQKVVAKKSGLPSFSIGIDYAAIGKSSNPALSKAENGRDALFLPKIGVTIPLYRKKYKAMIKEAALQMESAQYEKEDKVNQLSSLFETGYKDLRDGNRRFELYGGQTDIANKALDILLAEYATDGQNFEELLRMERKLLKYDLELDKARADRNAAVAFIYYLMGN